MIRSSLVGFRDLLFPGFCRSCEERLAPESRDFCPACVTALTTDSHLTCPRCSSSVGPHVDLKGGCPHCRGEPFAFDAVLRLGPYHGPLGEMIVRAKQPGGCATAEALGDLWAAARADAIRSLGVQVVVPIPLHWQRRWWRGFNQCAVLAAALAKELRLPCRPDALRRNRATASQTSQSPTARRENVKGAFTARNIPAMRGANVLLVDDVLTTGTTASEAAKSLKSRGVAAVYVAVVGHG